MAVEGDLCLRNIDASGVRFRRIVGSVAALAAAGLAWYVISPGSGLSHVDRLWVFVPLYLSASTLIQAREKT